MKQTMEAIEAVYENGVFRPLSPVSDSVVEGQHVRLAIEAAEDPQDSLELLRSVYSGLANEEIDEIEKIMLDRSNWSTRSFLE